MSTKNNGGPAFPQHVAPAYRQEPEIWGMSLRDYFAAKAMQAMLASKDCSDVINRVAADSPDENSFARITADAAFALADAMLAARDK